MSTAEEAVEREVAARYPRDKVGDARKFTVEQSAGACCGSGSGSVWVDCDRLSVVTGDIVDAMRAVMGWNTMFDHRATVITPVSRTRLSVDTPGA